MHHTCWITDEWTSVPHPPWFNKSPKTNAAPALLWSALHDVDWSSIFSSALILRICFLSAPIFSLFKEHLEGWCLRAAFCIVGGSRGSVLACCRLVRHLEWNPMWQAPWKTEDLMRTVAAHYRSRCNAPPGLQRVWAKDLCPLRSSKGVSLRNIQYKQSPELLQWTTAFWIVFTCILRPF